MHVGIDFFTQLLARCHQGRTLGGDAFFIVALDHAFQVLDRSFNFFLLTGIELVAMLAQALLHAVHIGFGFVTRLNDFKFFLVIGRIELGIFHHLLDLGFSQTRVRFDGDLVFFARALVFRAHVQDAVSVNVKRHLDLRRAARRGRDAF